MPPTWLPGAVDETGVAAVISSTFGDASTVPRTDGSRRRYLTMTSSSGGGCRPGIDTTVPHSARIWNYWLGGKDNYAVDRLAGEQTIAVLPEIVDIARASRGFLTRVVRYLAADAGIRQFLDIGTGLPTANNTHEVAQSVAPT